MGVPWGCLPPQIAIDKGDTRSTKRTEFPRAPSTKNFWRSIPIKPPAAEVLLIREANPTGW